MVPGWDAPAGGSAERGFLDWTFVFGLELLVTVVLAVASFRPTFWLPLVPLVIALEAVRGIADDVYMLIAGYGVASNVVFIVVHAAIIVSGVLVYRGARRRSAATAVPVPA